MLFLLSTMPDNVVLRWESDRRRCYVLAAKLPLEAVELCSKETWVIFSEKKMVYVDEFVIIRYRYAKGTI